MAKDKRRAKSIRMTEDVRKRYDELVAAEGIDQRIGTDQIPREAISYQKLQKQNKVEYPHIQSRLKH